MHAKVWADGKPGFFFRKRWFLTVFHAPFPTRGAFIYFLQDSTLKDLQNKKKCSALAQLKVP